MKSWGKEYLFYDFVKATAALPGILAFRPRIRYENAAARKRIRGGAILVGNHGGFFDPVYLMFAVWYRRHRFVCTREFFQGKKKFFFKNFLCIPIDRDNFGMDSFREIVSRLKDGKLVSMFPEGKIEENLSSFKSGMVLMAHQSHVPIVPVYIQHERPWYRRLNMVIGEPIPVDELLGERPGFSRIEEIAGMIHEREVRLQEICERG